MSWLCSFLTSNVSGFSLSSGYNWEESLRTLSHVPSSRAVECYHSIDTDYLALNMLAF
eukprot:gene821-1597_t